MFVATVDSHVSWCIWLGNPLKPAKAVHKKPPRTGSHTHDSILISVQSVSPPRCHLHLMCQMFLKNHWSRGKKNWELKDVESIKVDEGYVTFNLLLNLKLELGEPQRENVYSSSPPRRHSHHPESGTSRSTERPPNPRKHEYQTYQTSKIHIKIHESIWVNELLQFKLWTEAWGWKLSGARQIDIIVLVEPISSSSSQSYDIHLSRNLSPCRQSYCAISHKSALKLTLFRQFSLFNQPAGCLSMLQGKPHQGVDTKCLGLHGTTCFESRCLNATWESVAMKKAVFCHDCTMIVLAVLHWRVRSGNVHDVVSSWFRGLACTF